MKSLPPIEDIISQAARLGIALPEWKWPPLKTYKGFTHAQRVRGWQATKLAISLGLLEPPSAYGCRNCGGTERIGYHSEDYSSLDHLVPLCPRCHLAVHRGK